MNYIRNAIVIFSILGGIISVNGQSLINWQGKDLTKDSLFGISADKAYSELLKGKRLLPVVVAVIDGGVDTAHEDLKSIIWNNPKETSNGQDEDHNGYVDDQHGWNFIGGQTGNIRYDNLELTRIIRRDGKFYDSLSYSVVPVQFREGYQNYRKMKREFDTQFNLANRYVTAAEKIRIVLDSIISKIGKKAPTLQDFKIYQSQTDEERKVIDIVIQQLQDDPEFSHYQKKLKDFYDHFKFQTEYSLNVDYDPRGIVGDNYSNSKERYYGNNDPCGPHADHGTHVAGIIGAVRSNGIGIDGIASNVRIISIRVVPEGDERDKDVANAIRYAVDNGAKIINMSFGKPYSWDKQVVDEAVKYAMQKDALLVHAAGNDGKNLDNPENESFPNRNYLNSDEHAIAWINVGASGWKDDSTLVAPFSNYGKSAVDVFSPGVHIYSTMPGSQYEYLDGTSMAAPVVTGLAALIRGLYPNFTAMQVKEIIMKSVVKVNHHVIVKDGDETKSVAFANICVSGGIINAFNALRLAANYKK